LSQRNDATFPFFADLIERIDDKTFNVRKPFGCLSVSAKDRSSHHPIGIQERLFEVLS